MNKKHFFLFLLIIFFFAYTTFVFYQIDLFKKQAKLEQSIKPEATLVEEKEASFVIKEKKEDQEIIEGFYYQNLIFSDKNNLQIRKDLDLHILKINPKERSFKMVFNQKESAQKSKDILQENDCLAGANGIFFTKEFKPLGLIIEAGEIKNPKSTSTITSGIFYLTREMSPTVDYPVNVANFSNISFTLQAGPIILKDDKTEILTDDKKKESRTLIAKDKEGFVYLLVFKKDLLKEFSGVSLFEIYKIFKEKTEGLPELDSILNLDGGSSSLFYLKDKIFLPEEAIAQNLICIY